MATIAEKFEALRKALGLKQHEFAGVDRTEISKIESGANQLTGADLRGRVSKSVGLAVEDLAEYLEDQLSLSELLKRRGKTGQRRDSATKKKIVWIVVDPETRRKAIVYLKQPPQEFTDEAIKQAFEELRISDPEIAKSPSRVADAVRVVILGLGATLPAEQQRANTGRS